MKNKEVVNHIVANLPDDGDPRYSEAKGDEIVDRISSVEEAQARLKTELGDVDTGVLEVSLALVAVSLFFTAVEIHWVIRLFAIGAFFFSSHAARRIYWSYVMLRAPLVFVTYTNSRWGTFAIVRLYFVLFRRTLWKSVSKPRSPYEFEKSGYELALMSLLIAFTSIWIAAVLWIAITVFAEIK